MTRKSMAVIMAAWTILLLASAAEAQNYNIARKLAHDAVDSANANAGHQQAPPPAQAPAQRPAEPAATPQPQSQPAGPLTADQIARKAAYVACYQGADVRQQVKMTVVDAQGQKLEREYTLLRRDVQGDAAKDPAKDAEFLGQQKVYVYVKAPADVAGTALLIHKHPDRDDDRWLYAPGQEAVQRIAATDKRTGFVGSQLFYEDIAGRNPIADKHELLDAESDANYFVLKNTPKESAAAEFAYCKMWIHRKTFVVVKASYYDAQDKELRRCETLAVAKDPDLGYVTATKFKATDLRTGGYTELETGDVKYNTGLADQLFAESSLRHAPAEQLQQ